MTQMRTLATKEPLYQVVLWMTFGAALLTVSKVLTVNPWIGTILVAASLAAAFLRSSKRIWLWLTVLIIFSINAFGIFSGMALPRISLPGLGTMYISDLLLILATLLAAHHRYSRRTNAGHSTTFGKPLLALLVLVVLEVVQNIAGGLDVHFLLRGLRNVAYYLLFFIVVTEVKRPGQLRQFLSGLLAAALITSVVSYTQFLFGLTLPGSKVEFMGEFKLYRTYQAGWCLINSSFLVLLAVLFAGATGGLRRTIPGWFGAMMLLGAIIVSFARSTWGSMLVAISIIVLLNRRFVWKGLLVAVPFLLLFLFLSDRFFESLGGEGLEVLTLKSRSGIEDFWNRSGSFGNRLDFVALKWTTISRESPLLGRGFDRGSWYLSANWNPYSPTADSGIASLFVVFGYSGIILFVWIFVTVFRRAFGLMRKMRPCLEKAVVLGIAAFNVQLLIESFFGDRFTWPPAVAVLATSWAVLELIGRFYEQGQLGTQPIGGAG
jgi:hypothetical protein